MTPPPRSESIRPLRARRTASHSAASSSPSRSAKRANAFVLNVCNPNLASARLHTLFYNTKWGFFNSLHAPAAILVSVRSSGEDPCCPDLADCAIVPGLPRYREHGNRQLLHLMRLLIALAKEFPVDRTGSQRRRQLPVVSDARSGRRPDFLDANLHAQPNSTPVS